MKNKLALIFVGMLVTIGFLFRLNGLSQNNSFWIDEASSATFARSIIDRGVPTLPTGYAANDYATHFYLMAVSFKIFGQNEFAARLPSVIFGSLTIFLVYLLGKKLGGVKVGLAAAFLTTFSVLEISYSRQARSYQELQFFYLLTSILMFTLSESLSTKKRRISFLILFIVSFCLLCLTHKFGLLFLFEMIIYVAITQLGIFKKYLCIILNFVDRSIIFKTFFVAILLIITYVLLRYFNFYKALQETTTGFWAGKFGFDTRQYFDIMFSHLKYYHSFLWRQYPHITLLSLFGLIIGITKKSKVVDFFIIVFTVHFVFVITRVFPQFVRYVYLVFPLMIILGAYFIVWFIDMVILPAKKYLRYFLLIFIMAFLVINGNKFSIFPKSSYSLNLDMVEIPEPDFKSAYEFILNKTNHDLTKVIIIDNRTDAVEWYLGEGKPDYYLIGPKELEPSYNMSRGIDKDPVSGAFYLDRLETFKNIIKNNQRGFVVFEERALEYIGVDNSLIDFVKNNLKKEFRRESISGNELSIWPIEIYSWGFK